MAMVVLVLPASADIAVGPDTAARLARFGIGHASLLRDNGGVAVVLEGWAFDPERSAGEAAELIAPGEACRILRPLADLTVLADSEAWPVRRALPHDAREGS
jgi:hypothetical protein